MCVSRALCIIEGGVRVCGDVILRYFWCGSAVIFILTRGIAVQSTKQFAVITTVNSWFLVQKNVCGANTL